MLRQVTQSVWGSLYDFLNFFLCGGIGYPKAADGMLVRRVSARHLPVAEIPVYMTRKGWDTGVRHFMLPEEPIRASGSFLVCPVS